MSSAEHSVGPARARSTEQAAADELLEQARAEQRGEARRLVGMGLGLGALGAVTAVTFGAVCPVCVVAAPALITFGVIKQVQARRR
jgi:hypothetical protein